MTLLNIIDRRKRPYRFKKVNVCVEPTRHDNKCKDADQVGGTTLWMGYKEFEHVSLDQAIRWAVDFRDEVTLYVYDEDGGLYPTRAHSKRATP